MPKEQKHPIFLGKFFQLRHCDRRLGNRLSIKDYHPLLRYPIRYLRGFGLWPCFSPLWVFLHPRVSYLRLRRAVAVRLAQGLKPLQYPAEYAMFRSVVYEKEVAGLTLGKLRARINEISSHTTNTVRASWSTVEPVSTLRSGSVVLAEIRRTTVSNYEFHILIATGKVVKGEIRKGKADRRALVEQKVQEVLAGMNSPATLIIEETRR